MRTVEVIPAKESLDRKLKVAAYCRVSSEHDEQYTSFLHQQEFYRKKIEENPEWEFAGIYADRKSGTQIKNRPAFMKMMRDCKKRKIDLVLTKSLSRYGRDTLLTLKTLDQLCDFDVTVNFEQERLNSKDRSMREALTFYAANVQEESRSKSEDIKQGIAYSSQNGHVKLNHSQFLGYTRGEEGNLIVVKEEAKLYN